MTLEEAIEIAQDDVHIDGSVELKVVWAVIKTALVELATSPNSDYAAALRVIGEWDATYSTSHTIERLRRFCKERLNPPKAADCA